MRYRLRTLLILLAILPPLFWIGWGKYQAWKAEWERRAKLERLPVVQILVGGDKTLRTLPPGVDSSDLEHGKGP